ncbi:MAG: GTPase Era [Lachnospiraceae bacterium]|jgi:GTP-binding protein Era|nr:GTPase Era [Lachnospiraceae bacterium]
MSEDVKQRSGFCALIGRPNVGKSTLMNCIVGQKIAITSCRPQTTRNRIQTVYTCDRGQIVFLDTPGIHKAKSHLGEYMDKVAVRTLDDADVILWLVEPSDFIGAGEHAIIDILRDIKKPVMLVINKIDTVKYNDLLPFMDAYSKEMEFSEIIPVSALKDKGIDELVDSIFKYMPQGVPFYDEETVTDQTMRQISAEIIREKALRCLDEEVPHGIAVTIEQMEMKPDIVNITADIICEKDSHKGIIIGKQGSMLKKIGTMARHDIETMVDNHVNLKLWVKVRKDWRDNDSLLNSLGYRGSDIK